MKRHFIAGALNRHGVAQPLPHCTGSCDQGHAACNCPTGNTELANVIPLRPELPCVPIAITGGRVPRARRVRRFLRALWAHLTAERFSL